MPDTETLDAHTIALMLAGMAVGRITPSPKWAEDIREHGIELAPQHGPAAFTVDLEDGRLFLVKVTEQDRPIRCAECGAAMRYDDAGVAVCLQHGTTVDQTHHARRAALGYPSRADMLTHIQHPAVNDPHCPICQNSLERP